MSPASLALWRVRHRCRRAASGTVRGARYAVSGVFAVVAIALSALAGCVLLPLAVVGFLAWLSWPAPRK